MAKKKEYAEIINCYDSFRKEATEAKLSRMEKNKVNFDAYHDRQDWSHKKKGQSREFIPKVSTTVEQNANMVQQGLLDLGDWFKVEPTDGINEDSMKIKPYVIERLVSRQLSKDGFVNKTGDMLKLGMLGGLIIIKVGGKYVNKPRYKTEKVAEKGKTYNKLVLLKDKAWQADIQLIRQEDYYPDPTGRGLYEIVDTWMDLWEVKRLAEGPNAIYDKKCVDELSGSFDSAGMDKAAKKSRETDQNIASAGYRKQVKISEFWGNILDSEGNLIHENVVCTIANDRYVIQPPEPNPYWHQESPFITAPLLSVPNAVWPKAMMDAAVRLNLSLNELFNLMLDSGIMNVFGIKQVRKSWLDDVNQVSEGIGAGDSILVNDSCPPNGKAIESVYTGSSVGESQNMFSLIMQEMSASMFTSEIRSGGADLKNTRATAIVENSQALNNMSTGLIKNLEGDEGSGLMTKLLTKLWKVCVQNMNDMDSAEVAALIGEKEASAILAMGREELFADTVQSSKFKVFGISAVMNKMRDFTKLTTMLQTIFSNPALTEAFMQKYSVPKYLDQIMNSLDIDTSKIQADTQEGGDLSQQQQMPAGSELPDMQSQLPQAGAAVNQGDMNAMASSQPAANPQ